MSTLFQMIYNCKVLPTILYNYKVLPSQFVGRKHEAYDACEARDARYTLKDYLSETIWNLDLVSQALL